MVTVALVEKNRCSFDRIEEYVLPLLYQEHQEDIVKNLKAKLNDYLWSVIKPYIDFVDIESGEDFLTIVCQKLIQHYPSRNPDEFFYHTEGSYSFPKKYMEIIHCQPLWSGYEKSKLENINNIGCLFSLKHSVIENRCIIISNRYDMSSPNFIMMDKITKEDILRVIRRRFFFSAILIKENTIVKYYYQTPTYLVCKIFGLTERDKIQKLSFSHLKYNLVFYFRQDKTKYINQIATRINGSQRIYGDVLVLHEMEDEIFANLSRHEFKRLNVLSYGRLYDRELKDDEIHTMEVVEIDKDGKEYKRKMFPYWSRYIIVERRMLRWKENRNRCINCYGEIINSVVCQKCYRIKFCSFKCQKEFDFYHSDECVKDSAFSENAKNTSSSG
ncbi:MAG: zinc finger MYND domain-containing protein [Thermoplasmata archaeon]